MGAKIVSVAEKPAGMLFHEGIDPMDLRGWRPWAREKMKAVRLARVAAEKRRGLGDQLREENDRAA